MQAYLYVMGGGAAGAALRFALSRALPVQPGGWPLATLCANIAGCLVMGMLSAALWRDGAGADGPLRWALGVGLLGGFTTFSAFSLETVRLIDNGAGGTAMLYVLASVAGSVVATAAGLILYRAWWAA